MCGISAIVSPSTDRSGDSIEQMVAALCHRGPDAHAAVRLPLCTLGHTRLSIIDLESGDQPMTDGTGRYTITFNGEIYNYEELRKQLLDAGTEFRTHSDTEVILAAYARWGAAALDRFRGMFAFAIWDAADRVLFAARDLFGEKPLYYAETGEGGLILASEIKALLASGRVSRDLDLSSVDGYLAFGYVPPTRSIYRAIRPLPAGHWMRWEESRITLHRYWAPRLETRDIGLDEAAATLRTLLKQAVRRQMVADVPVGAFLSGGLDSTSIVALMEGLHPWPVQTFSVGFGDEINELPFARAVARRYETDHHEVDLGAPPVASLLDRMAEVYDEPFADSSSIPTYLISQFARGHVKVVLAGDGGDEMFGGYHWYPMLALSEQVAGTRAEWMVLRVLSRAIRERARALHRRSVAVGLSARWPDMWLRAAMNQVYVRGARRAVLWGDQRTPPIDVAPEDIAPPAIEGLNRAFYFDLTTYLPGDILVKVDRASMAHGLETRAPFLDRDLAEFALSLPASLKADADGRTKIVLREACEQYWPEEVRTRRKHGFGAPYGRWLQKADVGALVARTFRPGGPLRSLLPGISTSPPPPTYETWMLLTLGLWLERRKAAS
jgi:asparagine synthase (glutamine-hydrolysing)